MNAAPEAADAPAALGRRDPVRRPPRRRLAGFTLVEVLVALAVTGLTLSALGWLTSGARRLEARVGAGAAAREEVMAAERVFRAVVEAAMPDVRRDRPEGPVGTADTLALFSRGPAILMLDRPQPLTFRTVAADGGVSLRLAWQDPMSGAEREEPVLDGATAVSFAYFGGREGIPAGWRAQWDWPQVLPKGILMRIDMPGLGPPVEIVVRAYPELPAACLAMPQEPACRKGLE